MKSIPLRFDDVLDVGDVHITVLIMVRRRRVEEAVLIENTA